MNQQEPEELKRWRDPRYLLVFAMTFVVAGVVVAFWIGMGPPRVRPVSPGLSLEDLIAGLGAAAGIALAVAERVRSRRSSRRLKGLKTRRNL